MKASSTFETATMLEVGKGTVQVHSGMGAARQCHQLLSPLDVLILEAFVHQRSVESARAFCSAAIDRPLNAAHAASVLKLGAAGEGMVLHLRDQHLARSSTEGGVICTPQSREAPGLLHHLWPGKIDLAELRQARDAEIFARRIERLQRLGVLLSEPPELDVSVVLATRNRASRLQSVLGDLAKQETGGLRFETLVGDNGSTDETTEVLQRAAMQMELRVARELTRGVNPPRNAVLPGARGRLVLFTDDDTRLEPSWIREYHAAAGRWPQYDLFGSPIEPIFPENDAPQWLKQHPFTATAFAALKHPLPEGPFPGSDLPYGPSFAVRARSLNGIQFANRIGPAGGKNPMGGETELLRRLWCCGERVIYVPGTTVGHHVDAHQLELDWFYTRAFRLGRSRPYFWRTPPSTQVLGMPTRLLRRLPKALWTYAAATLASEEDRFSRRLAFHELLGRLYEHYVQHQSDGDGE